MGTQKPWQGSSGWAIAEPWKTVDNAIRPHKYHTDTPTPLKCQSGDILSIVILNVRHDFFNRGIFQKYACIPTANFFVDSTHKLGLFLLFTD